MFTGYVEALHRFEQGVEARDPIKTYTAVFEALNWAVALDSRTAAHFVPDGTHIGYGWRTRIPNSEVMGGVRHVRNSIHHQWSDAVRLAPGFQEPITDPLRGEEWVWRAADDLPPPPPN